MIAQLSALGAIVILVLTVVGAVHPGVWVWVLVAILFLSGVQLTTVGILGRYMARVHAEVLARPLYLVDWVKRGGPAPASTAPASMRHARHRARSPVSYAVQAPGVASTLARAARPAAAGACGRLASTRCCRC